MKKNLLLTLLISSLASIAVVACASGSSSSAATPPATTASQEEVPAGYAPVGNPSAPTPVAINAGATSIALPSASGSYATFDIPVSVTAALLAAGLENIAVSSNGSNVVMTLPADPITGVVTTYVLTPPLTQSSALQTTTVLNAESYTTTGATTNILQVESSSLTPAGVFFGTASNVVLAQPNPVTDQTAPVIRPISACAGASGTTTAVQGTDYLGVDYLSFGTSTGSVCVISGADPSVSNLSTQVPSRYSQGSVTSLTFTGINPNLYGYWNENVSGQQTVYRVTGTSANGIVGNSFWNITSSAAQTNSSGTTLTFSNVPSSINSVYSDSANNLYIGTTTGSVYKLANGFTTYTSTPLINAAGVPVTGPVVVGPTSAGTGATASAFIESIQQVFNIDKPASV